MPSRNPANDVEPRLRWLLSALLLLIAGWGLLDLVLDGPAAWRSAHGVVELGFIAACLLAVAYLWRGWMVATRKLTRSEADRAATQRDRDRWRQRATKLLDGLGVEIDRQFAEWSLSPKEREVALMLLKGYGHKEAAAVLGRSERTVRQQSVSVYRKSGLGGRAELSAFFLEDLLLPSGEDATAGEG